MDGRPWAEGAKYPAGRGKAVARWVPADQLRIQRFRCETHLWRPPVRFPNSGLGRRRTRERLTLDYRRHRGFAAVAMGYLIGLTSRPRKLGRGCWGVEIGGGGDELVGEFDGDGRLDGRVEDIVVVGRVSLVLVSSQNAALRVSEEDFRGRDARSRSPSVGTSY
jgi:hypothetical protein